MHRENWNLMMKVHIMIYTRKYLKKNRFIYCLMQMTLYLGEMKSNAENCMRKQYIIMIFNSLLTYRNSDF